MKNSENTVDLIKGIFSQMEGKDIVLDLLDYKINYHRRKNFGWEERFGKPNQDSLKRIEELKAAKGKIQDIISKNESAFDKIEVHSQVAITFIKEKELAETN